MASSSRTSAIISVGANLDYLKQGSAHWFGIAAMGRFILNDSFYVAARAEYVNSKNQAPICRSMATLYEFTGLGAWTVNKHYELRAEVRADMTNKDGEGSSKARRPRRTRSPACSPPWLISRPLLPFHDCETVPQRM
jgi:hypothetical protein